MTQTSPNSAIWSDDTPTSIEDASAATELRPSAYVSLSTLQTNYEALARLAGPAETGAVVKADAYGHGLKHIAPALQRAGCQTFFVAYLHEGITLRKLVGNGPFIHVFNGFEPDKVSVFKAFSLSPVCNHLSEIACATQADLETGYSLHFDTGMNRLGLRPENVSKAKQLTAKLPPVMVMSHLACADQPEHERNELQLQRFESICEAFPASRKSLSATAGLYLGQRYTFDVVRPGIGLYGGGPARPPGLKLKTALTLTAPIVSVFDVPGGDSVGYGASFTTRSDATMATVALGYADGYLRSASNYGFGVLDGVPCPIVGRVSMDLTTIDVSDLPQRPEIGHRVEFIGPKAGYEIQAEALGTLGYELTARLGGRISRHWGD